MSSSALYGRQGGRALRDEIREVVREEMAALDRRLLACERVSDTNAVTVQQLREHVGQSLHSARDELEARFDSKLADSVALCQSQQARAVEKLEAQLADHADRLNGADWALQRQDVAFARTLDEFAAEGGARAPAAAAPSLLSTAQGGLGLQFSPGGAGSPPPRTASAALREARQVQSRAEFERSSSAARSPLAAGAESPRSRRSLQTYLFEDEPTDQPLMGLIARDAADIERRLRSMEDKLETERKVTIAALYELEHKLEEERATREAAMCTAARAVLSLNKLMGQADAGATFMQLSRDGVTLSAEDMRAGFARLGVAVDGAELEFISSCLDLNGDGSIDAEELSYLGQTAQDVIKLASHVEQEVQAGLGELVGRLQQEIKGSQVGVRSMQRLMTCEGNAADVFQRLDTNGDGSLNRHELAVGFAQLGVQLSDEELTATIAMLDENQDGQVSMEEFVRMGKISTNLDDTRAQLQESQSELSAAQGSHAQRLEQVVAAQEEMLATQEQLLAVNNQRQREVAGWRESTIAEGAASPAEAEAAIAEGFGCVIQLMTRPEAAQTLREADTGGTGLLPREDFAQALAEALGRAVPEPSVAAIISMMNASAGAAEDGGDAEGEKGMVKIAGLVDVLSLSARVEKIDSEFREEIEGLMAKEKERGAELDKMLAGRFGSEAERAKESERQNELAREAVQAALQDKIAAERAAREETNAQMREEVEAKERARAEREKLEAEEAAAALEEERARAEEERQLAAEDAAARAAAEEAAWQKKHGILLSAFVMVELEKKNNFEKMWCVLTPGLLSIHEKALMPPHVVYPLAGSTISPIPRGKRKGVDSSFQVEISEECRKRVRGQALATNTTQRFVLGFAASAGDEAGSVSAGAEEWQSKMAEQVPRFATDHDIDERAKRHEKEALTMKVKGPEIFVAAAPFPAEQPDDLAINPGDRVVVLAKDGDWWKGHLESDAAKSVGQFPSSFGKSEAGPLKWGWLYVEQKKNVHDSRLCVVSAGLLTLFEHASDTVPLASLPLAQCEVTAETDKRKGMEGGSFRVKLGVEAQAYASGETMAEFVLSCREASKRKRGEQVYASDAWRELILAQAFKPPSWLGEDADAFEHSEEALVSYEVEILTGTVSGAGTKAKVFIDLEGAEGGRPRRSGRRVLNTPGQPFDKGKISRFTFDCTALGELKNMKIGHDDSGFSANWFCEKVTIKRANSAQQWEISVGKWFDAKKGDGLIERDFPVGGGPAAAAGGDEEMPAGLTKMQQAAWKKKNGKA